MAKTAYSPMEVWRGRVGSEVYAVQNGKQVIRNYSPTKGNPQALADWRKQNLLALVNMDTKTINVTIKKTTEDAPTLRLQYSKNGIKWNEWGVTTITGLSISIPISSKVYIRGINNKETCLHTDENEVIKDHNQFSSDGLYGVEGPIIKILDIKWNKNTPLASHSFAGLFYENTNLCTPPSLPSIKLARDCYRFMFYGCTSLMFSPQLPALEMQPYCYSGMFYNCKALTVPPELPATKLSTSCYIQMFFGCTSLTEAPELPATNLSTSCYNQMFYGCRSLTEAPELQAQTLQEYCYYAMFYNCINLDKVKCLATEIKNTDTQSWLYDVKNTGTFIKNTGIEWPSGASGIPNGWTVEEV